MKRVEVLRALVAELKDEDIVISCYSPTCHELFSVKDRDLNFYVRDSMGMPTSLGLGLALALPSRRVVVLEGDGGLLMNLGSLATIAGQKPSNLSVVVLDNECYENTGGQPTATAGPTDFEKVARGAGFSRAETVRTTPRFVKAFRAASRGPAIIISKIEKGKADVPPISLQHIENKYRFARALRG